MSEQVKFEVVSSLAGFHPAVRKAFYRASKAAAGKGVRVRDGVVRFPDRESAQEFYGVCAVFGLPVSMSRVVELESSAGAPAEPETNEESTLEVTQPPVAPSAPAPARGKRSVYNETERQVWLNGGIRWPSWTPADGGRTQ